MNITKFNFYGIRFLSTQHVLEEDELTNLKTKKLNYLQEVNFVLQDNLEIKKDIRKLDLKVDNFRAELSGKIDNLRKELTEKIESQGRDLTTKIENQGRDLTTKIEKISQIFIEEQKFRKNFRLTAIGLGFTALGIIIRNYPPVKNWINENQSK